jgi:hypothetical protein
MRQLLPVLVILALGCGCGGGEAPATAPVTPPVGTPPVGTPPGTPPGTAATTPPGTIMVTVSASSSPPGATVTGGGALLGTTPFVSAVPVPAPTPGVAQTFEFTFQFPGYNPTTITASPTNGTITLNAVLAPAGVAVAPPGGTPGLGVVPPPGGGAPVAGVVPPGTRFTVRGSGGGRIYDYHTTTATVMVPTLCRIRDLDVDVDGNHSFNSDLVLRLTAPDGTTFSLQSHNRRNPFRTHSVRRAAGHMSGGNWELSVEDTVGADSGNLSGFSLEITCG